MALAAVLAEVPILRRLELSECGIEDVGASCMNAVLATCPHLEELDMSRNLLGSAACGALVMALPAAESLHTLRLAHAGISDADGALVCNALGLCPGWRSVDLSGVSHMRPRYTWPACLTGAPSAHAVLSTAKATETVAGVQSSVQWP